MFEMSLCRNYFSYTGKASFSISLVVSRLEVSRLVTEKFSSAISLSISSSSSMKLQLEFPLASGGVFYFYQWRTCLAYV